MSSHWKIAAILAASSLMGFAAEGESPALKTRNVVLIVSDGLRWQEIFRGPDPALMNEACGAVENPEALLKKFARPTPEEGRAALMPFFWSVIATKGQLFGNHAEWSLARDTNRLDFSYPGYNEMITGAPDPRMDTNDPVPNPNVSVFEWLNRQPGFEGRVVAYGTWSVFDAIFNVKRSGLKACSGWQPSPPCLDPPVPASLRRLYETTTRYWNDNVWDSFLQAAVLDEVRRNRPRVLFVGYGETDEWAHMGRYDLLLQSARSVDGFIAELWNTMQKMPEYRDTTTFLITADHGRGHGLESWKDHGDDVEGASEIWIAALGPDTPALGERVQCQPVTQAQIASTIAALVGYDYGRAFPSAAPPLPVVVPRP